MQLESGLPQGWVPDGVSVFVVARVNDDDVWESIVPEFNIAGRGASATEAVADALELLDDYLMVCAREGKTFEDARRPISARFRLSILSELIALMAGHRLRRRQRRECEYRIPLQLGSA